MSKVLRRPIFRGGRVDSRGTGITSGLDDSGYADGGRVEFQKGGGYFTDTPFGRVLSDVGLAGRGILSDLYNVAGVPTNIATEFLTGYNPGFSGERIFGLEGKRDPLRFSTFEPGKSKFFGYNTSSVPGRTYTEDMYKDEDVWSALRYTQMASPNPQIWVYSNAGDQHSIVLNKLRERAYAAIHGGSDDIGWFEWSAPNGIKFDNSSDFWLGVCQANPSLGYTVHPDNIRAVLSDPEDIVRTEVLCQWVDTINPVINPSQWESCKVEGLRLNPEADTWLAIDLSPDRKQAALVASQKLEGDQFQVILLQTWHNPQNLDDKALANDLAEWFRKYPVQLVAYSARTASAVAARLAPAGIRTEPIDGLDYAQSCDELLGAISSQRLAHSGQDELTKQCLSAVKLPFGDGYKMFDVEDDDRGYMVRIVKNK